MEYMYIPKGIKKELLRFGEDCDWEEKIVGTVRGGTGGHSL